MAAVCTITTIEMMRLSDNEAGEVAGRDDGESRAPASSTEIAPSTLTPRLSRRSSTTAALASASPIRAPGIRASICSESVMIASTPRPMTSVKRVGLAEMFEQASPAAASIGPSGAGSPRIAGSWEIRMCAEMPARKPIVTGIDKQIGDPAQAENAGGGQHQPDHQRERRRERDDSPASPSRERGKAAGEDRRDRRIRARRQKAVAAERRERERARHEGEKADLRGEAAKARGRHLFGDDDCGERQSGEQVAAEKCEAVAGQRAKNGPRLAGGGSLRRPGTDLPWCASPFRRPAQENARPATGFAFATYLIGATGRFPPGKIKIGKSRRVGRRRGRGALPAIADSGPIG